MKCGFRYCIEIKQYKTIQIDQKQIQEKQERKIYKASKQKRTQAPWSPPLHYSNMGQKFAKVERKTINKNKAKKPIKCPIIREK